ncbi:MAG: FTR1 family iron permease [Atopobiaceae bacterium]|nr:FTR1 family iron permease [Atopobiaceae bacterium]
MCSNVSSKRRGSRLAAFAVALLVALSCTLATAAQAVVEYYSTYAEAKEALGADQLNTWNKIVDQMDLCLDAGKEAFAAGDMDLAYKALNDAYYGWYETTGFERTAMGYIGNGRKSEVELAFAAPKAVAKKNGSQADYDAEVEELRSMLREDANKLDGTTDGGGSTTGGMGAAATFAACFSILVREGLEAILVVGAIIAYLVKSGNQKSLKSVYIGAILGIVCSFISAWLLNQLKLANAAPQEIIEGVTALIAVCVLYYVSNWMLSKSETEAWNAYIQGQVDSSVETGSNLALAFTAWLSVFREGAEVILFYQPLLSGDHMNMVWAGVAAGFAVLAAVYIAVRYFSVRLPLKPFFRVTSIFMFIMSISFLGSGIKELIEGNVLTMTPISWIPSNEVLEVLGIFPCWETIIPQLILIGITVFVYIYQVRKSRRLVEEAKANGGA